MATHTLTAHQRTVLNYITEFQGKRGYSPSLADLAVAFGVRSKNSIAKVINTLVLARHLEKDPKGRIKIIAFPHEEGMAPMTLPLFGPIAAGFAAPVEEHAEEQITIESYLVKNKNATFLLRVKGDSMIGAGIHEGDLVLVDKSKTPKPNDIVVGVMDGEFTLKRLKREKGKVYLQAENPDYPDLYAIEELQVAGVVVGLVRKMTI
ncbi:MAG: transcriptional repressor LexA [Candidatus Peribacteraceae bacterium]